MRVRWTSGRKTRTNTARTKSLLRTLEMKTLRAITGKILKDRIRNTEIQRTCGVENIGKWERQRRRYEHVKRMDESNLSRMALESTSNTRRPLGRSPKR